jgi:gliding motility-associated-like protein
LEINFLHKGSINKALCSSYGLHLCFLIILSFSVTKAQQAKAGAGLVSSAKVVNEYTYLTDDAVVGASVIKVNDAQLNVNNRFSSLLSAGDLLFIIQVQGALISTTNDSSYGAVLSYNGAGIHEFVQVQKVNGKNITIDCALKNKYSASGKTIVVRVPRYQSLDIKNNGVVSADFWNGNTGGIVVIEVAGLLNIDGKIDVSAQGFRGGAYDNGTYSITTVFNHNQFVTLDSNESAEKGESIAGYQTEYDLLGGRYGRGAAANGGGGGNSHNAGGGGGANGGDVSLWTGLGNPHHAHPDWVSAWNLERSNFALQTSSGGGRGGYSFSKLQKDPTLYGPDLIDWLGDSRRNVGGYGGRPLQYDASGSLVFFGGGGGAGDANNYAVDTTGGNGGGMVFILSKGNVTGSGKIIADGGKGGNTIPAGTLNDATGGGGGGGSIVVISSGTISGISLQALGGNGGSQFIGNLLTKQKYESEGMGGGGGGGYIALSNTLASVSVSGGDNGITTSQSMLKFIHNGATQGAIGEVNNITSYFDEPVLVKVKHDTVCAGQPAFLEALPQGGNSSLVQWYTVPAGGTPIYTGGTYSFVANTNACYYVQYCPNKYRDTVCVKIDSPLPGNLPNELFVCAGKSMELDAGVGNSYTWNTGQHSRKITVNSAGKYSVVVNASGCSTADSVDVHISPNPFDLGSDKSACAGNKVVLDAGYWSSYSWSTGETTKTIAVSQPGMYKVLVSSGLCSGVDSIKVIALPLPSFEVSSKTICTGEQTDLLVSINDPSPNSSNWIVQWLGGGTGLTKTVTQEGKYLVKVTNKTTLCADTSAGYLTIDPPFEVDLGPDRNICDGDSASLKVSSAYQNVLWSNASTENKIVVKKTGGYSVEVTNAFACKATGNVQVNVWSFADFNLGDDIVACTGESVTIGTNVSADHYEWLGGNTSAEINVDSDGEYILTLSNAIGCEKTDTVNVSFLPYPKVYPANDTTLCLLDSKGEVALSAEYKPGYHYWWNTGDTTAIIKVNKEGSYLLQIQFPAVSCVYNKTVVVNDYCDAKIFFPTAFTPNGDMINDVFYTPNFALKGYHLMLFDRWGNLLYETFDSSAGWDGTYAGKQVQEDVYVWKVDYAIEMEDGSISKKNEVGRVALLR